MTAARTVASWLASRQADIVWKLMAAVALGLSVFVAFQQYDMTACQAGYNEASNASTRVRAEAAEADRVAQQDLAQALAGAQTLDDVRGAAAQLVNTIDENDLRRAQNPVPPSPQDTCG